MLDTPPQVWSAENWGSVRRTYGDKCSFALMIVAAQAYGVMPGRDYNLALNTPRRALARELFGREVADEEFERVRAALLRMGFAVNTREGVLRQTVADILLYHGSPKLDVVTDDSLKAMLRMLHPDLRETKSARRWCASRRKAGLPQTRSCYAMTSWRRTESGRPAASIRFRTATPIAASVCCAAKPRARSLGPISTL
jgi:hypothetical protein